MNHDDKIRKILSNLSGNKILEIKIIPDEIGTFNTYYLKAYFKTSIVNILLYGEEKNDFIGKMSEHGWYVLYQGVSEVHMRCQERYFHVTSIEDLEMIDSDILKIAYKNTDADITYIVFDDPIDEKIQQVIDSLKKAGRFDLLLKLS